MAARATQGVGAIGFRVKTGYAIAVLLAGPAAAPRVLLRRQVMLCDPKNFYTRQPYHAELELPEKQAEQIIARSTKTAGALARDAVRALLEELGEAGFRCGGVGLAVGSLIDPETIASDHMRAHALEGRLYRVVLEGAAGARRLRCIALVECEAYKKAAEVLRRTPVQLQKAVAAMGDSVGRPWRAEEKLATLAAWVTLGE
jgi:hypothetical protein